MCRQDIYWKKADLGFNREPESSLTRETWRGIRGSLADIFFCECLCILAERISDKWYFLDVYCTWMKGSRCNGTYII